MQVIPVQYPAPYVVPQAPIGVIPKLRAKSNSWTPLSIAQHNPFPPQKKRNMKKKFDLYPKELQKIFFNCANYHQIAGIIFRTDERLELSGPDDNQVRCLPCMWSTCVQSLTPIWYTSPPWMVTEAKPRLSPEPLAVTPKQNNTKRLEFSDSEAQ